MIETLNVQQPFTVARGDSLPAHLRGAVVAIGNFDGVHRGHRAVIAAAVARARTLGRPAVALTFEPHPRSFFRPDERLFRLTDEQAKLRLFAGAGLDGAIVLRFDAALAEPTAMAFIDDVLVNRLAIAGAVVGFDFQFGRGRAGTTDLLATEGARLGFSVDVVPALHVEGRRVSSGVVRRALAVGDIAEATRMLGFPWFVSGEVVHGDQRGRTLGYPTANLRVDPGCELRHGVYAVRVGVGGHWHDGVANFGRRPMFDVGIVLLEAFLFDYSGDLYGQTIDVAFIDWIRHELNFPSVDDLVQRMGEDTRLARAALARTPGLVPPLGQVTASDE